MRAFLRTTAYLIRSQLRSAAFYAMLAAALGCAVVPMLAGGPSARAAAICDEDGSALSRALIARAAQSQAMTLTQVGKSQLPSALARLKNGTLEAVLVIGFGYGEDIIAGEYQNAVKLYVSPYSTSAQTFSETVAAAVMSQWLERAAESRAAKDMGPDAGADAAARFAHGGAEILVLDVEGAQALADSTLPASGDAQTALFLLGALCCFLVLCFPASGSRAAGALPDRFLSRGWNPAAYFFAGAACPAAPVCVLAVIPCAALAISSGVGAGLMAWLMFLMQAAAWVGLSAVLTCLVRSASIRLSIATVIAAGNAIMAYPAGLMLGFTAAKALFAGYWFTAGLRGEPLFVLPLAACAAFACALGLLASRLKHGSAQGK